ncbi:MAG: hypothetical protein U9P44_04230 [archaeon]|nr:hypothetical protein [archaeon]
MVIQLQPSNYRIYYAPHSGAGGHGFSIEVSEDFVDFAKELDVNEARFENIALAALRVNGYDETLVKSFEIEGVCSFDGGLLEKIIIPGDATALVLERYGNPNAPVYLSHNLDNSSQVSVIFAVMTAYLVSVEDALGSRYLRS